MQLIDNNLSLATVINILIDEIVKSFKQIENQIYS